jgi:hypothetical protein
MIGGAPIVSTVRPSLHLNVQSIKNQSPPKTMIHSKLFQTLVLLGVSFCLRCTTLIAVAVADSPEDDKPGNDNNKRQCATPSSDGGTCHATPSFSCGLYLAKSSIPNSGLGLFAGKSHEYGSVLNPPEIVHQLILKGRSMHANPDYYDSLVRSYTWDSFVSGGGFEASYVESLIPGIGMAANCFTALVNTRSIMGKSIDSAGLYSSNRAGTAIGPGAGAFSTYHGMTYVAETAIEAGGEIFADYGDAYFRHRVDVYGNIPLKPEFDKADEMVRALWEALPESDQNNNNNNNTWQPMWDAIRQNFVDDERTRNALPKQISDLPLVAELGTARHFLYGENPRSIEWLETNGYCTDTLEVRNSDIPHAGRGAFARRSFVAGEKILPLPLLQIPRASLDILDKREKPINRQLLLNYCFGHPDSSLLLMPYSSTGGFINHASGSKANAKVVWASSDSDPSDFHRDEWMSQPPSQLFELKHTGLLMYVVALRDIAEPEEITLDYGQDWTQAWEQHFKRWNESEAHVTAAELNESRNVFPTIFERQYPSVETACHYRFEGTRAATTAKHNPNNQYKGKIVESMIAAIEANAPSWVNLGARATMSGDHFRPCRIIARHGGDADNDNVHYTVKVENREKHFDWDTIPDEYQVFVKNVPPLAILFVDKAHTSHQQYRQAFRHEIGFPNANEMWPAVWRDLE